MAGYEFTSEQIEKLEADNRALIGLQAKDVKPKKLKRPGADLRAQAEAVALGLLENNGAHAEQIFATAFRAAQVMALQPGSTKNKNGKTYTLNKNHRWTLPGKKDSPGQQTLFNETLKENHPGSEPKEPGKYSFASDKSLGYKQKRSKFNSIFEELKAEKAGAEKQKQYVDARLEFELLNLHYPGFGNDDPDYTELATFNLFNDIEIKIKGRPSTFVTYAENFDYLENPDRRPSETKVKRYLGVAKRFIQEANKVKDNSAAKEVHLFGALPSRRKKPTAFASCNLTNQRIEAYLNNMYERGFTEKESMTPEKQERRKKQKGFNVNQSPEAVFAHEYGHALHLKNIKFRRGDARDIMEHYAESWSFLRELNYTASAKRKELEDVFPQLNKQFKNSDEYSVSGFPFYVAKHLKKQIEEFVSEYATVNPLEFVAEYYVLKTLPGKPVGSLPPELDRLYDFFFGPEINS